MESSAYFGQVEKNIHALINEKKHKEAYLKCKQYIKKYPNEDRFESLMQKVEKLIVKENEEVIDRKIKETNKLLKKGEYQLAAEILEPLLKLNENHQGLKRKIIEAQKGYSKEMQRQVEEFEKAQRKKLNKLFKENEIALEEEIFIMEKNNPGNQLIKLLAHEYRDKIIEKKISEKSDLIYSDKYEAIQNFTQSLHRIEKNNQRVIEIEEGVKKNKSGTQVSEKSEYVYKGEQHLSTLMRLGKYDKAVQVAQEILEVDKENEKVRKILVRADKKLFKQTKNSSIDSIKENQKSLKEEYKKDKSKFIKI